MQVKSDSIAAPKSGSASKKRSEASKSSIRDATGETPRDSLQLSVEGLHFENISVVIDGLPDKQQQRFRIEESSAAFKYMEDSLQVKLVANFQIDRVSLDDRFELSDETLDVSLDFFFDRGKKQLDINAADLNFRRARFDVEGHVDFKGGGMADLRYEAADEQLQFTRLFLSSEGFDNLKSGQLHLRGAVKGPFVTQLPLITCEFGTSNVHMEIPNSENFLRSLNLSGYFESGNQTDFSDATLRIDTLHAVLPSGYIQASTTITNLKDPSVAYDLDASLRLEHLARFFDLGSLDSLAGRIDIKDTYKGTTGGPLGLHKDERSEPFTISMEGISFAIPEILDVQDMNGRLTGTLDSLKVDFLKLHSRESDLELQGTVSGLSGLIISATKPVWADIRIQSGSFDFPRLFRSLPETAAGFPYTIRDLELDVEAEIDLRDFKNIEYVPEMHYHIRSASGVVEGLLPQASVRDGRFSTLEKEGSYVLDFEDFKLDIRGYDALVGLAYFGGGNGSTSIAITMDTEGMNPGRIFFSEPDSIPGLLDAEIVGRYRALLQFPLEDGPLFQSVNIGVDEFEYRGSDSLSIQEISLKTNTIAYEAQEPDSLLQTLNATGDIFLREVETSRFQTDSLEVFVKAGQGAFEFVPRNYLGKGKDDFGRIVLEPFLPMPRYELEYTIKQLKLEEFLRSFNEEDFLTGAVDLQVRLSAEGNNKQEISNSIEGSMMLAGEDLTLIGLDLDEVITNFSRSQSFNFVDLGAVLLTGPVGVVYTKGLDYFNLVTSGTGDSTRISRFSSRWDVGQGRIKTQDVAFATLKNRMAAKGWLSTDLDSLDINLAVIDRRGCAIIDQRIYGNSKSPERSKLNVIETLLAPVTDAVGDFLGVKCEVFYDGVVQHPIDEKKGSD